MILKVTKAPHCSLVVHSRLNHHNTTKCHSLSNLPKHLRAFQLHFTIELQVDWAKTSPAYRN